MQPVKPAQLYRLPQAAEILGLTVDTLRRLVTAKRIAMARIVNAVNEAARAFEDGVLTPAELKTIQEAMGRAYETICNLETARPNVSRFQRAATMADAERM